MLTNGSAFPMWLCIVGSLVLLLGGVAHGDEHVKELESGETLEYLVKPGEKKCKRLTITVKPKIGELRNRMECHLDVQVDYLTSTRAEGSAEFGEECKLVYGGEYSSYESGQLPPIVVATLSIHNSSFQSLNKKRKLLLDIQFLECDE